MKASKYTKETVSQIGVTDRAFPEFNIGDTISIAIKVTEGNKERLQKFEGDVIAMSKNGASSTFTVRKTASGGIAVERIFPFYTPIIDSISLVKRGRIRRAKLYYLRDRQGKKARIKEKLLTRAQKEQRELSKKNVQKDVQDKAQAE